MITIQKAGNKDLDSLLKLLVHQFCEHEISLYQGELKQAIYKMVTEENLGFFLLARDGDLALGVAAVSFAWTLEHGGRSAWLDELYVVPEHREKGIGGKLIEEVLREATRQGCLAIDLEVEEGHRRSEGLYARLGFEPLERSRWARKLSDDNQGI